MAHRDPTALLLLEPQGPTREIVEHAIAAIDDAATAGGFRELRAVLYWLRRAASARECASQARAEGLIAEATHLENCSERHLRAAVACVAGADPRALATGARA